MTALYTMLLAPKFRAFDLAGAALSGGKVYVYESGTSTRKESHTDASLASYNAWPVVLDANGEANIWVAGPYKIVVTDAAGVQQYSADNLYGFGGSYVSMPEQDVGKVLAWGTTDGTIINSTMTIADIESAVNAFNTITMLEGGVVAAAAGDASASTLNDKLLMGEGMEKAIATDGAGVKTMTLTAPLPTAALLYLSETFSTSE